MDALAFGLVTALPVVPVGVESRRVRRQFHHVIVAGLDAMHALRLRHVASDLERSATLAAHVLEECRDDVLAADVGTHEHGTGVGEGKGDPARRAERTVDRHRGDSRKDLAVAVTHGQHERLEPATLCQESGPFGDMEGTGVGM